jgi:protein SCO1/2
MQGRPRFRSSLRAALLVLCAAAASAADSPQLTAGVFDPPRMAPDFALRGSDGGELVLSHFRGKVVVLGFGFTTCPDVCPTTLATLASAHKKLGERGGEVQIVYVTVDPERDDPERLRDYLKNFDASFVGGTGSAKVLEAVRNDYGIAAQRIVRGDSYGFSHSSYTYLIDRAGRLRALMPYGSSADAYVHDLLILLAP